MTRQWIIAFVMSWIAVMLSGCTASLKAYPERSYDSKAELTAMELYLSSNAITNYMSANDSDRNNLTRRQWRDAVVNARIRAIDLHFNDFQQALFQEGVGIGIATDWATLALGGAGALYKSSAQTLSAISAAVVGGKASFDKNAYFDKSMPTLLAMMVAKQKEVLVRIRRGLRNDTDQYPLELALNDVDSYYNAGSIPGALMGVAQSAGETAEEADKQLKILFRGKATKEHEEMLRLCTSAIGGLTAADLDKAKDALKDLEPSTSVSQITFDKARQLLRDIVFNAEGEMIDKVYEAFKNVNFIHKGMLRLCNSAIDGLTAADLDKAKDALKDLEPNEPEPGTFPVAHQRLSDLVLYAEGEMIDKVYETFKDAKIIQ